MSRRMFSDEVTATDIFLDMPKTAQLLYFHLGMNADDDGFISSPKMIMRSIGAGDDDLKILFAKKFLIAFESGIVVIKHWRINNQIRKDRYRETKYLREKKSLFIRENGSYTTNPDNALPMPLGYLLPSGNQLATNWQPSIGKVSIGKVSIDIEGVKELFDEFWLEYPSTKRNIKKSDALKKFIKGAENVLELRRRVNHLKSQKATDQKWLNGYIPNLTTYLNQERWDMEIELSRAGSKPANVLTTEHSKKIVEAMENKAKK